MAPLTQTAVDTEQDGATSSSRARIAVHGLAKTYTRRDGVVVRAIDDVTLDVAEGEFLVLLGPSGCGKTTLLRVLAGLEQVQAGRVELDGRLVDDPAARVRVPTERRQLSMMFQSYALWPHKTVFGNVEYPLTTRRLGKAARTEQVQRILDAVGVGALAGQYPGQLSGGQQQRVALARALVAGDGIVLFDEPLSNVDAKVRELLRTEIRRLHRELGFTAVYVTHDQDEAMTLATRLIVLREGRIAQSGTPSQVYRHPVDQYVARFMGAGNEIEGLLGDAGSVDTGIGSVHGHARGDAGSGDRVVAFSRPEDWRFGVPAPDGVTNRWRATVTATTFLGSCTDHTLDLGGVTVRVRTLGAGGPAVGDEVDAWVAHADVVLLPADADAAP